MAFGCDVTYIDERAVVAVRGELDIATAPVLTGEVDRVLGRAIPGITVDLGSVTFLDSSGVAALLDVRRTADERGIVLGLENVTRQCRRTIDVTGLTEILGLATQA